MTKIDNFDIIFLIFIEKNSKIARLTIHHKEFSMGEHSSAYLLCPTHPPLQLMPNQTITIGRDRTNDFVLPYTDISRNHTRIYYRDTQWIVEDLDSKNGTMLNDKFIKIGVLHDGDQITLGSHIIFYQEGELDKSYIPKETNPLPSDTMAIPQTEVFRLRAKQSGWQGNLRSLSLDTVLQAIEADNKTGCLQILSPYHTIEMFVKEGLVIHCKADQQSGISAFFTLLSMQEGHFNFKDDVLPSDTTMHHPIGMLLLEYARQQDEKNR